jgi:hypothetical protein
MKKVILLFSIFTLTFLSSCLDTVEEITINDDNSGVYTMKMDMSKMIELANQMGGEKSASKKAKEKKDTVINIKDLMANMANISAAEKELYNAATMHIKLDEENAEMKIDMSCPFTSINQLPEIKKNFFKLIEKVKAFDKISNKSSNEEENKMTEDMPNNVLMPSADSHHNFSAKPGLIENSITDPEGYKKEMQADSSLQTMQQMMSMIGEPSYKVTITTAKEIKKYTGNGAILSPNKKTVTFVSSFNEMLEHPEKLGYKIEY